MSPNMDPVIIGYQVCVIILTMLAMLALLPGTSVVKSTVTFLVVCVTLSGLHSLNMLPF